MHKKYFRIETIESDVFFLFILLINIFLLCLTTFYPSMDGASHLYNSKVITELLKGNSALKEFYTINTIPIPNWTSHFILSFLTFLFPGWLSEKIFLILYVSGMALSFRFLIKTLRPENVSLSLLIYPFIYSFLFHLGFYNFNFSFILFFYSLSFWLRNHSSASLSTQIKLTLLLSLTYFSNILAFGFLGLSIGLYIIYYSANSKTFFLFLSTAGRKLFLLFLTSIPSLIFALFFYKNITFFPSKDAHGFETLLKWIHDGRALIVYNYSEEEKITQCFFYVLVVLLIISFWRKKHTINSTPFFSIQDIMAIPSLLALLLLFIIPSGSGAGMMSDRFCLIFFMLSLIWISSRATPLKLNYYFVLVTLLLHFSLLFIHYKKTIRELDFNAKTIYNTGKMVADNSIVLPINLSDSWLEIHFSNYLGIDKPLVILENYEAAVGWFPVKWNHKQIPHLLLGDKKEINDIRWINNSSTTQKKEIDYVLIYGNTSKLDDSQWNELKEVLFNYFKLIYRTENNYAILYKRI